MNSDEMIKILDEYHKSGHFEITGIDKSDLLRLEWVTEHKQSPAGEYAELKLVDKAANVVVARSGSGKSWLHNSVYGGYEYGE